MNNYYDDEERIEKIMKTDKSDLFAFGSEYFKCGYISRETKEAAYYNYVMAQVFEIIGKVYGNKNNRESDYKRGVDFISENLGISKTKIKILRKKVRVVKGYVFKIPYSIDIIIKEIIELLLQKNTEIMIYKYMLKYKGEMYRDVLIYKQYSAIMNSSENSRKIEEVYEKLMVIDEKVR